MDSRKADGLDWSTHVAQDTKMYEALELFAATPPAESLKYLMRRAAQAPKFLIMHVGVARAYCTQTPRGTST